MKAIAEHEVVNQLMLKVGIIGTAQLLWLLGFMLEVSGSIDNQLTFFMQKQSKGLGFEINCSCNKTNQPHLYRYCYVLKQRWSFQCCDKVLVCAAESLELDYRGVKCSVIYPKRASPICGAHGLLFNVYRTIILNTHSSSDEAVYNCSCRSAPPARLKAWTSTKFPVTLLHHSDWPTSHTGRNNLK